MRGQPLWKVCLTEGMSWFDDPLTTDNGGSIYTPFQVNRVVVTLIRLRVRHGGGDVNSGAALRSF